MVSNKHIHIFIITLLSSQLLFAQQEENEQKEESKLPLLKAKQSVDNIRFISGNGKFTYYQKRSGSLIVSSNYEVTEIIEGEIGSQYQVKDSQYDKRLLIERDQNFHTYLNVEKPADIFTTELGSKEVKKIGEGKNAQLHLEDKWASYFNPTSENLQFQNLEAENLRFKIKTKNFRDPYFIPDALMVDEKTVLYTDINNKGVPAILKYDRNEKEVDVLLKSATATQRIDFCQSSKYIFIMEFGVKESNRGTTITQINKQTLDIDNANVVYQSRHNDLGGLICRKEGGPYFVKNTYKETGRRTSEAARLNLEKKEAEVLTNLKFVSHIMKFDESLLIPLKGKYYVLEGKSNLTQSDNIKIEKQDN